MGTAMKGLLFHCVSYGIKVNSIDSKFLCSNLIGYCCCVAHSNLRAVHSCGVTFRRKSGWSSFASVCFSCLPVSYFGFKVKPRSSYSTKIFRNYSRARIQNLRKLYFNQSGYMVVGYLRTTSFLATSLSLSSRTTYSSWYKFTPRILNLKI